MKRTLSAATTAAAFLMTAALAAQAPAPQQPPSPTPQTPSQAQRIESTAGKITVNGCLEKADAQQASAADFILTSAKMGPAAPGSGAVGTTGAPSTPSASTSSAAAGAAYRLDADAAKLTPHVGHRVEIVGTTSQSGADSSAARPAEPGGRAAATPPSLKVESVKMLSQTCNSSID